MKLKKILLSFCLLTSICFYSQNKNFSIENKIIYWKYVYEDSLKIAELRNNPKLEFKTDSTGIIKRTNFNDKKLKELTGEFKIETKKGKYRISIYNIRFYVEPISLYSGGIGMQSISEHSIEDSLIKKNGTIRESYLGYNLTETLNPHLVELFTIKKKPKTDW